MTKSKICNRCGKRKPVNRFSKRSASPDGRHCFCKTCMGVHNKAYYEKHRAKLTKRAKKRYKRITQPIPKQIRSLAKLIPSETTVKLPVAPADTWFIGVADEQSIDVNLVDLLGFIANATRGSGD